MKLHTNFIPAILLGLTALGLGALKDATKDDFVKEYNDTSAYSTKLDRALAPIADGADKALTSGVVWLRSTVKGLFSAAPPQETTPYRVTVGYGGGTKDSVPAWWPCKGPACGAFQQYRKNGLRVWHVDRFTHLNQGSSFTGSLRYVLESIQGDSNMVNKPLDIVVFDAAGTQEWSLDTYSRLRKIRGVYIAGQSAPGHVNLGRWGSLHFENSEDVGIRSMSIHGIRGPIESYALRSNNSMRMLWQNISVSHGPSREVQFYSDTTANQLGRYIPEACMQWASMNRMLISHKTRWTGNGLEEPFESDAPTILMFTGLPRGWACVNDVALINSVVSGTSGTDGGYRMPNNSATDQVIHQNLIYNGGGNPWQGFNNGYIADVTYNMYLAGPYTSGNPAAADYYQISTDSLNSCRVSEPHYPCDEVNRKSLYVNKNHVGRSPSSSWADTNYTGDQIWTGSTRYITTYLKWSEEAPPIHRRNIPNLYNAPFGFDTLPMNHATFMTILDSAGEGYKIDSLGNPYMLRDTIDRRARQAIIDTTVYPMPGDVHRDSFNLLFFPLASINSETHAKCRNNDGDGMCDAWEELATIHGDTSLHDDSLTASGYYALELYLMGGITNLDTIINFGGVTPDPPPGAPSDLAFRGAEGYGKYALGECRDSVYYGGDGVHGNSDDWPLKVWKIDGSVRYTPEAALGLRTIIEDSLKSDQLDIVMITEGGDYHHVYTTGRLLIDKSCVYFTGLPSSGDGAALTYNQGGDGWSFNLYVASESTNVKDVLIRDLKVKGDSTPYPHNASNILKVFGGNRIYFDHNSWVGGGDGIEFYGDTDTLENLTWGNSLAGAVGFTGTPEFSSTNFAADLYDDDPTPGEDKPFKSLSILRSAFMSSYYRMPLVSSEVSKNNPDSMLIHGPVEWINVLSYDAFGNRMAALYGDDDMDVIGSWFGEGVNTTHSNGEIMVRGCYSPQLGSCGGAGGEWFATPGIYANDIGYYQGKVLKYSDYFLFRYIYGDGIYSTPLPDSIRKPYRSGSSTVTGIYPSATLPDTLFNSADPRKLIGAARGLTCGGTLYARRDSTDQWFIDRYNNNSVGNTATTTRGWDNQVFEDSLVFGTPCTDTDSDGLPDAFESWSGVTKPDSMIIQWLAIEYYLNGDSALLASYLGGGSPPPPNAPTFINTYGDSVRVRRLAAKDSVPYFASPDTYPIPIYPDSVPGNIVRDAITYKNAGTTNRVLLFSCDTSSSGATIMDSFAFYDTATAMGLDPNGLLQTRIPGCP